MSTCPLCANSKNIDEFHRDYFFCPTCELRFLNPARHLSREDEDARYRSHQNEVHDPAYRKFLEPLCNEITARVKSGEGLDFGAGPGPALAAMLTEAGLPTAVYDPVFWPDSAVLNKKYDFVTATEVIEHMFKPGDEFKKLRGLLKPSGWLGLMTLMYQPSIDFAEWYYPRDPTHVVFYSQQTFHWIAGHFGFEKPIFINERTILLRHLLELPGSQKN